MIIVKVKQGESIERALKRYKNKYRKIKVLDEIRDRKQFTKKSVKRRATIKKAKYINKLNLDAEKS